MDTGSWEVRSSLSVLSFAVSYTPAESSHNPVGVKPWDEMRWVKTVAEQGVAHTHCPPRALSWLLGQFSPPLLQKIVNSPIRDGKLPSLLCHSPLTVTPEAGAAAWLFLRSQHPPESQEFCTFPATLMCSKVMPVGWICITTIRMQTPHD